jgi:multiple sugar transport system substrate-binding protein
VAAWPAGPAGRATGSFGSGFGVTRDSDVREAAWEYLSEYLSVEGMEFMWGEPGRGSPAREEAYDAWMSSPVAPENAEAFLDALATYAVTGSPYQTLAAAELNDIAGRHATLLRSGEATDVAAAIAAIVEEAQPVLDEATERLRAAGG